MPQRRMCRERVPLARGLVDPTYITQDATSVCFSEVGSTTTNGRIWRVAKP